MLSIRCCFWPSMIGLCVCWTHPGAIQKWLSQLRCQLGCGLYGPKEPCIWWGPGSAHEKGNFGGHTCACQGFFLNLVEKCSDGADFWFCYVEFNWGRSYALTHADSCVIHCSSIQLFYCNYTLVIQRWCSYHCWGELKRILPNPYMLVATGKGMHMVKLCFNSS